MGIGAGWPKNSSGSPLPMRSRSRAIATTPPERSTLNTSRIDAAPSRRAIWGSPSRIAWVSIGMIWTPWARRAPTTRSKSCLGRSTSASSAILPPILFQPARPTSHDPKCIDATTTPLPRAMASSKWYRSLMSIRDGRSVRRDDISITSTQQWVRLRTLRRTRCLSVPVADGGNDMAEVVAQAVEAARHCGQQRVGGAVAEPVRHRLRERTDQGLGTAVGVVRQHRVARDPLAGARLHRHVAGLRQRRRLPDRPAVNSSRVWRVPPPQLRAARRRRGRCAALRPSRRRR